METQACIELVVVVTRTEREGNLQLCQGLARHGVGLLGFNIRCNVRIQLSYRHFGNRAPGVVTFFFLGSPPLPLLPVMRMGGLGRAIRSDKRA